MRETRLFPPSDEDCSECSAREYQLHSVKEERRVTRPEFYEMLVGKEYGSARD